MNLPPCPVCGAPLLVVNPANREPTAVGVTCQAPIASRPCNTRIELVSDGREWRYVAVHHEVDGPRPTLRCIKGGLT
jgi:hypothetical protein